MDFACSPHVYDVKVFEKSLEVEMLKANVIERFEPHRLNMLNLDNITYTYRGWGFNNK